jgi:hypothetical protein
MVTDPPRMKNLRDRHPDPALLLRRERDPFPCLGMGIGPGTVTGTPRTSQPLIQVAVKVTMSYHPKLTQGLSFGRPTRFETAVALFPQFTPQLKNHFGQETKLLLQHTFLI